MTETQDVLSDLDFEFVEAANDIETPEVTTEINTEFAESQQETPRAKKYRKKVSRLLGQFWRPLLDKPSTLPDASAILLYGPELAYAAGQLADDDEKARKVIDFVTDGADNAYIGFAITALPLVMQLIRNHEKRVTPTARQFRIPFTKFSVKLKFGLSLGRFRNLTHDPNYLTVKVLTNPTMRSALEKQGITIAYADSAATANGRKTS